MNPDSSSEAEDPDWFDKAVKSAEVEAGVRSRHHRGGVVRDGGVRYYNYKSGGVVPNPIPPRPGLAADARSIFNAVAEGKSAPNGTGLGIEDFSVTRGGATSGGRPLLTSGGKPSGGRTSAPRAVWSPTPEQGIKAIQDRVVAADDPLAEAGKWLTEVNKAIREALDGIEQ